MVLVLKRGASIEEIAELKKKMAAAQPKKEGIKAAKYSGVLKLKEDPMDIQRRLRDEWE